MRNVAAKAPATAKFLLSIGSFHQFGSNHSLPGKPLTLKAEMTDVRLSLLLVLKFWRFQVAPVVRVLKEAAHENTSHIVLHFAADQEYYR